MAERNLGDEIDEIKTQLQTIMNKISSFEDETRSLRSFTNDLNNTINSFSSRIKRIETNGLKSAVSDLRDDLDLQRIKVTRLERKDNGF
ncbi:hypothetical protein [Campylobacter concisus]|uniref:hypothetical protein n=1 Tax=Campylobacter concisus TaxID=199 RepID=UPI000CD82381|nr:hypothetical protein [Campylobacter concisus]